MAETTTIEVTKEQRDQLEELKQYDREPIRDVVEQLLSEDNIGNLEPYGGSVPDIADGEALAELQDSIETVESRTGKIERMLEEMNRR